MFDTITFTLKYSGKTGIQSLRYRDLYQPFQAG